MIGGPARVLQHRVLHVDAPVPFHEQPLTFLAPSFDNGGCAVAVVADPGRVLHRVDLIFRAGVRQTVCNILQAPVIASVWRVNLCKRRLDESRAFRCPANGRQTMAAGLDLGAVDARKIRTFVVNIAVEDGHVAFFVSVNDVHI